MAEPLHSTSGGLRGGRHRLSVRIYYEDTDFSGAVYHASYLRFFERGRTEFLRALGIRQSALHGQDQDALGFVVRRMSIEFLRPARMDDLVVVETLPKELRPAAAEFEQAIFRRDELLATCLVTVAAASKGRARRMPAPLFAEFQRAIALAKNPFDAAAPSSESGASESGS